MTDQNKQNESPEEVTFKILGSGEIMNTKEKEAVNSKKF